MKVHAILAIYNDRMFLSAMLESIKDDVDSIIVADGAYKLYYENYLKYDSTVKPWSTDGSVEIIRNFKGLPEVQIIRCPDNKPWRNQNVKRNALVDAVPLDDWFIVIAADEMLSGDVQEGLETIFESGCCVAHNPLYNVGLDTARLNPYWHARIHLKMEGMHYYGTHWQLRDKYERIIELKYPLAYTDRFVFVHFRALKPVDRIIPHEEYMRLLQSKGWLEPDLLEVKKTGVGRTTSKVGTEKTAI